MEDGFNKIDYTNDVKINNDLVANGANYSTNSNPEIPEIPPLSDNSTSPKKVAKITSISLASISALLLVAGGGSALLSPSDASLVALSVEASDTVIFYTGEITKNTKVQKTIRLTNEFTDRTIPIELGEPEIDDEGNEYYYFYGVFDELVPKTKYTVSVMAGSVTLDKKTVRMQDTLSFRYC